MVLEENLREVAAAFEQRLDQIAIRSAERQRLEIDEVSDLDAPELWEVNRRLTRDSRRVQALHLSQGMTLPSACPQPDAEAAHFAARAGLPLSAVLDGYRIGHAVTWDGWLDAIESLELPDTQQVACMRAISRFANSYHDRIVKFVVAEFERELDRVRNSPEKQRVRLIRDLINGHTDSSDGLGYDLDQDHIGVIAWGGDAKMALEELATVLQRRLLWAPA